MKSRLNQVIGVTAALAALTLSPQSHAGGADGTGNGGSPVLLRMKLIKRFINFELRQAALAYLRDFKSAQVTSQPARAAIEDLIARDAATDIQESAYVIQDSCEQVGGQAAGGAIAGDLGGPICLSARELAELDTSKAEIVGLILHEHAHHFGYVDADYAIYKAVYQTVRLASPAWSSAEPGSSPQPQPPVVGGPPGPCAEYDLRSVAVGFKCRTSKGSVFERVDRLHFGEAWKGADGLIWGDFVGQYSQREAVTACQQHGGILPSDKDFKRGEANGIREVLPNMDGKYYWSSSISSGTLRSYAFYFDGIDGIVVSGLRNSYASVRCVAR